MTAIPGPAPERHATRADTRPFTGGAHGGTWLVFCRKTGCGWFEEGTYYLNRAEYLALRGAHLAGTEHETRAEHLDMLEQRKRDRT